MPKIRHLFANFNNAATQETEKITKPFISPGRPKLVLDPDDNTLQFMYEQGCSIARLARLCHCSESTIRRHLSLKQHK